MPIPRFEIDLYDDATAPRPTADFVRFLLIPFAVSLLLAGEVYWLRQLAAGAPARDQSSALLQVQLLMRPDPIPIATEMVAPLVAPSAGVRPPPTAEEPDHPIEDETPINPASNALPQTEPATISRVTAIPMAAESIQSKAALKFQKALLRHIEHYQSYPNAARRDRLQGIVQVLFAMRRDGTVLDIQIKASSGIVILDKEAVETIRRAQPLPPIPAELPGHLNILLPVAFDLS
jgi:periplasmic protein TonB